MAQGKIDRRAYTKKITDEKKERGQSGRVKYALPVEVGKHTTRQAR